MRQITKDALAELMQELTEAPRREMLCDGWQNGVPTAGGVYVIWNKQTKAPVYVGESCNLEHRFGDMYRIRNHTFRKKIAKERRCTDDDDILSGYISECYCISYIALDFGRQELEEYLRLKWEKSVMNKPPKRLKFSDNYTWLICEQ